MSKSNPLASDSAMASLPWDSSHSMASCSPAAQLHMSLFWTSGHILVTRCLVRSALMNHDQLAVLALDQLLHHSNRLLQRYGYQ